MKICDLTQFYAPGSGGVKRYLLEKRRYVEAHTQDEHWLIIPGEKNEWESEGRLHTVTIRSPIMERRAGYRLLWNTRAVRQAIAQIRPDILEVADPYQLGWTALRVGKELGIPVIGFYHSHVPELAGNFFRRLGKVAANLAHSIVRRYVRNLYGKFDRTLVASETLAEELRGDGLKNADVCPLGVDVETFQPGPGNPKLRQELGIPEEAFLLLFVGRLSAEKNVSALLKAFEQLSSENTELPCHLLIIGDGPLQSQVAALQKKNPRVHGRAHVTPSELAEIYRSADLFVHPGLQETFGLVMLESQVCGCPVLGIRGSRLEELCFGGLELWANGKQPGDLAQAIRQAANSREALQVAGQAAARTVRERFSWKQTFDRLWKVYINSIHA